MIPARPSVGAKFICLIWGEAAAAPTARRLALIDMIAPDAGPHGDQPGHRPRRWRCTGRPQPHLLYRYYAGRDRAPPFGLPQSSLRRRFAKRDTGVPGGPLRAGANCIMNRSVGRIAQLVEQLTLNQRVVGSSPTAPTKQNQWVTWCLAGLARLAKSSGASVGLQHRSDSMIRGKTIRGASQFASPALSPCRLAAITTTRRRFCPLFYS
jgi:hypothetical protein